MMTTIIFKNLRKKDRPQRFHHNLWPKPEPICYRSHARTAWVQYFPYFISNLDAIIYVSAEIIDFIAKYRQILCFCDPAPCASCDGHLRASPSVAPQIPSFTVRAPLALQSVENIRHFSEISSNNRMETDRVEQSLDYRGPN